MAEGTPVCSTFAQGSLLSIFIPIYSMTIISNIIQVFVTTTNDQRYFCNNDKGTT